MAKSVAFTREDFRRKLRQYGLADDRIEEFSRTFEKNSNHLDVVTFVIMLERAGIARRSISEFLKDAGIDDITIINIFGKADLKKTEAGTAREISQVVLEE